MKQSFLIAALILTSPLLAELPRAPQIYSYSGVDSVAGVLQTANGSTIVSDPSSRQVQEFNASGLNVASYGTTGSPNLASVSGMDMNAQGDLVVVASDPGQVSVYRADGSLRFTLATEEEEARGEDPATTAVLFNPNDAAFGSDGRIYVADMGHNRIAVFSGVDGHYLSAWGTLGFHGETELYEPHGLTVANGLVYVADSGNARVMVYDADGHYVKQIGQRGYQAGQFDSPYDVAVDGQNNVWVADNGRQSVMVFNQAGDLLKTYGDTVTFEDPNSLYASEDGTVLMGDGYSGRVMAFATGVTFSRNDSGKTGAVAATTGRLSDARLAFGPVPAKAGQPMIMQLPFNADRINWELLSLDMRTVASGEGHNTTLASMDSTQGLDSGVYLIRTRVQVGNDSRQEIQKIIVTR